LVAAAVSVNTGVIEQTANIDTADSGGDTVSHPIIFQLNHFDFHFKIFAPPDVFKVLLSESFWLNDDLVITEFVLNKSRTNNRPTTALKN